MNGALEQVDPRRAVPSVDAVLRSAALAPLLAHYRRDVVVTLIRQTIERLRLALPQPMPEVDEVALEVVAQSLQRWQPGPRRVINATGVILHTNLGRAPLSHDAKQAAVEAAGYATIEYDLESGTRGSRHTHLTPLLCDLTAAEDAVVVNNAAAALVLTLSALCKGHEVIISRGQAVEIGGGFRIPTIMRQAAVRLVEVGTTNRTRLQDYADALSGRSAALLRVHASNFKVIGFTESVALTDMAALAHEHALPLLDDLGSGALLDVQRFGLAAEPTVQQSIEAGADLVVFSGDKLLGGPQAGLIVGRAALLAQLRKHPLMRALRPDKITIAALGATLRHYIAGEAEASVPVWRMIAVPQQELGARAECWLARLQLPAGIVGTVIEGLSTVGGGSLPGEVLPTYVLALQATRRSASWTARALLALRESEVPVIARIHEQAVLLDPRTVSSDDEEALYAALGRLPTND